MDRAETVLVDDSSAGFAEMQISELNDLQLALVGGGNGETIL
jgi:hypothetical protein